MYAGSLEPDALHSQGQPGFDGEARICEGGLGKFYPAAACSMPTMGTKEHPGKSLNLAGKMSMADFTELGEGVSLGGIYAIEHRIRHDGTGAFYSVLTEDGERRLLKIVPEHHYGAARQFATWQRSRHLRHPHLVDLRDVGRSELAGDGYFYGVFEYPDDVLSSALEQGPLSEEETRSVLDAALTALRYLHGQGLVHGAVDPDHVVAVGETVKLATDALRDSDDPEGHPEDVRQLGELVRRLRMPEPLSEPLATVVRHATLPEAWQRWTLAEIARAVEPPPAVAAVAPPMPVPVPVPVPPAAATPAPAIPAPAPSVRPAEVPARSPKPFPKWIVAGVGAVLLFILMYNLRSKPDAAQIPPAAPAAMQPLPPPRVSAPPPAAPAPQPAPSAMWRVIAFTYRSRDMAAKKVNQINNRWPDLRAAVFTPKGRRGYYLVALGNGMNRDEAVRLQRRARSQGLPRDTYVQNYSE